MQIFYVTQTLRRGTSCHLLVMFGGGKHEQSSVITALRCDVIYI